MNTLPEGGGEFYAKNSKLTMPAGNPTLYALWSGDGSSESNLFLSRMCRDEGHRGE